MDKEQFLHDLAFNYNIMKADYTRLRHTESIRLAEKHEINNQILIIWIA